MCSLTFLEPLSRLRYFVPEMLPQLFRFSVVLAVCVGLVQTAAVGQQKKTDCRKPPQVVPAPKPPKGAKKPSLQGSVEIEISEEGEVVSAKTIQPSSSPSDQLESLAKSIKFKPRPGCGVFKTVVNFSIEK